MENPLRSIRENRGLTLKGFAEKACLITRNNTQMGFAHIHGLESNRRWLSIINFKKLKEKFNLTKDEEVSLLKMTRNENLMIKREERASSRSNTTLGTNREFCLYTLIISAGIEGKIHKFYALELCSNFQNPFDQKNDLELKGKLFNEIKKNLKFLISQAEKNIGKKVLLNKNTPNIFLSKVFSLNDFPVEISFL